ncbi:hypothetical protein FVEG_16693 [Fusarium verticillioides 7600]|uniref:Uncharacterized protein n=1 Tax=Gibberella moniliformis (strain M3125 / FGSC 7600) TaxID=334819 RepID=W7MSR9_GIBM7|nr:hypothetical protein FVEG_16693 [Fusarium verticillioides 7600]EWG50799.1 hypothetical protein FVEG_16693 [Fusarium verticillioides 7600]
MSDAAPPYDSSGSPPAYEEIEKKLNELIGPNPTVEKVLKAAKSVSPKEAEILVQNSKAKFPLKTERQKEDFALGIASATSSDDFKPQITSASSSASRAANEVARIFQKLHLKILEVDRVHESGFAKVLLKHKDVGFDDIVIKFCADKSISIPDRENKIQEFIDTAEGFKKDSSLLDSRFQDLITDFSTFVDGFSEWAKDKEKELSDKIKKVEEEIKALKKKLVDLKIARDVFALIGASILPILAILLEVFKPAAIPILIAGLIAAGVTMAIIIGLLVAIQLIEHELEMKEDEKKKLEDQKELIRATRTELVTLGSESLLSFKLSVSVLSGYWQRSVLDATEIKSWLQKGARDAEEPKYMKDNLNNAVTVYSVMAQYMEEYARGVESQGN